MTYEITLETCKTYATEANLRKAMAKTGLLDCIRHMVVRTPDGRWTAIFLVSEWLRQNGGYVGIASQYGFMSV